MSCGNLCMPRVCLGTWALCSCPIVNLERAPRHLSMPPSWWEAVLPSDNEVWGVTLSACAQCLFFLAPRVLPLRRVLRISSISTIPLVPPSRGWWNPAVKSERRPAAVIQGSSSISQKAIVHPCTPASVTEHTEPATENPQLKTRRTQPSVHTYTLRCQ